MLLEADEAEACAQEASTELRGRLRIAAPVSFGYLHLASALAAFLVEHPKVEVELELNDRFIDLVGEGYDLGIRSGQLEDSSLVVRPIAASHILLAAAPAYIAKHGAPETPNDLARHVCLIYGNQPAARVWRFRDKDKWITPAIHPQLVANNGDVLCRAAIEGLGIVALPSFIIGPAIAAGSLRLLLPGFPMPEQPDPGDLSRRKAVAAAAARLHRFHRGLFHPACRLGGEAIAVMGAGDRRRAPLSPDFLLPATTSATKSMKALTLAAGR